MLLGDHLANVVLIFLEQVLVLEHVSDTSGYGHFLPSLEGFFRASDRLIELGLRGLGDLGEHILGEGTDHVNVRGGFRIDPLAVDKVFVDSD